MIEVTNLTKRYGDHIAVNDLSFRVEKGQIYGFLGPNGAGKSTTMNIITGYLAPTTGTVTIDGHDISKEPEEAKKHIGYLPELPPLYVDMTVEEYLNFVADMKKVPRKNRSEKVKEVMEKTQILDMSRRLIKNLSKGYRQRVGIAQAMLGDPEVLILDEPSVGLDPKQIIEIRELIKELGKSHTIILSSHILSEVSAVCDHIMIIAHGQLVASDSPDNLQKRMAGSMQLSLTVKGTEGQLREALNSLDGIEEIQFPETGQLVKSEQPAETEQSVESEQPAETEQSVESEQPAEKEQSVESEQSVDTEQPTQNQQEDKETQTGLTTAIITCKQDSDIREQLFYCMVKADLPILQLEIATKSLEDIFLELTENVASVEPKKRKLFNGKKEEKES